MSANKDETTRTTHPRVGRERLTARVDAEILKRVRAKCNKQSPPISLAAAIEDALGEWLKR